MNLGLWLRKSPQPHIVVADGKRIEVGNRGGKWRDMIRTIESLKATELSCLDSAGNIIRAITIDDDDDDEKSNASKPAAAPAHCAACGVSLNSIASLLADAYERGANAHRDAYKATFEENTKLVRMIADRLGAIEILWQKSMTNQARLVMDAAEARALAAAAEGSGDDSLMGPLLSGLLQAQAQAPQPRAPAPPPAPAPNGKGHRK